MLNIHKFQSGYELFTTLCIVGDSNLAGIYEYLTSSRGLCCKKESIVIVISGNWEYCRRVKVTYRCVNDVNPRNASLATVAIPLCDRILTKK